MRAEITVKITLNDELIQEIMKDEEIDNFTAADVRTILSDCDISALISACPEMVVKTIKILG